MGESKDLWMVGDVLNAMRASLIPDYVTRIMQEVQNWLTTAVSEEFHADPSELLTGAGDRPYSADLEYLFNQLEWVRVHADLIPVMKDTGKKEEAVILSVGPILLDEGLRMMVDHAALFAAPQCRRVWIVSDTWIIGDVLSYIVHLQALRERGIEIRFMLVTPWGYSEIPWNRE